MTETREKPGEKSPASRRLTQTLRHGPKESSRLYLAAPMKEKNTYALYFYYIRYAEAASSACRVPAAAFSKAATMAL